MRVEQAKGERASDSMRNRVAFLPGDAERTDPFIALVEDWVDAQGGFVMNTEEEIAAAFRDLRAGRLGR